MGRREEREEREEERRRMRWDAGRCVFQNEDPTLNGWEKLFRSRNIDFRGHLNVQKTVRRQTSGFESGQSIFEDI